MPNLRQRTRRLREPTAIQPEGIEPEEQHIIDLLNEYDAALAQEESE